MSRIKERKLAQHIKNVRQPDVQHRLTFKDKECRYCKNVFKPQAPSHLYCKEECSALAIGNNYYQRNYGLSLDDVEAMLQTQNHLCAICKTEGFKMNDRVYMSLNVDHCHSTGKVRGLLCHNCNRGLGIFQDNVEILKSAITYLEGATTISEESTYECTEARSPA